MIDSLLFTAEPNLRYEVKNNVAVVTFDTPDSKVSV